MASARTPLNPALADLRRRGVDVRLGQTVRAADARYVTLSGGERIQTDTVIWAAGVKTNSVSRGLGLEVAIQTGRYAGQQVARLISDKSLTDFRYRDKGVGFRNRLEVLIDWAWKYFTSRGAGAILLEQAQDLTPDITVTDRTSGSRAARRDEHWRHGRS